MAKQIRAPKLDSLEDSFALNFYNGFDGMVFPGESRVLNTLDFIRKYTMDPRPGRGHEPFSTFGHEWQEDILNDKTSDQIVMKCSQIGISEVLIRKALALVAHHGLNIGYVLPSFLLMQNYAPARIRPVIEQSQKLSMGVDGHRQATTHYQFSNYANLYLFHSTSDTSSVANALDGVFLDEYDRCAPESIDLWPQRLGHSIHKLLLKFSTPTGCEIGIHGEYLASDQKVFMFKCGSCGHWQTLAWPASILFAKSAIGLPAFSDDMPQRVGIGKLDWEKRYLDAEPYIGCTSCGSSVERCDPKLKQWVATYPDRPVSGYSLSRFHVPRIESERMGHDASTIIKDFFKVQKLREFYNQVLGLPFSNSSDTISDDDMHATICSEGQFFDAFLQGATPGGSYFMGVDQGKQLHVTICRVQDNFFDLVHAVEISMAKDTPGEDDLKSVVSQIEGLVRLFRVSFIVCDGAPDINLPRAIAARMRHKSSYVFFNDAARDFTLPSAEREQWQITANRNWVINSVVDMVKKVHEEYEFRLPANARGTEIYYELLSHFTSMTKVESQRESDKRVRVRWVVKSGKPNHFLLSTCYAFLAYNVRRRLVVQDNEPLAIPVGLSLLTPASPVM